MEITNSVPAMALCWIFYEYVFMEHIPDNSNSIFTHSLYEGEPQIYFKYILTSPHISTLSMLN